MGIAAIKTLPLKEAAFHGPTERERQIIQLIWSGFRSKEIGEKLKISTKTVESHRANIMKRLRVVNTAQLLRECLAMGLIVSKLRA